MPNYNERNAVINHHLKKIPSNSLLLVDRGYYSDEMVRLLSDPHISVIFRMKKDFVKCTELIKSKVQFNPVNPNPNPNPNKI